MLSWRNYFNKLLALINKYLMKLYTNNIVNYTNTYYTLLFLLIVVRTLLDV